MINFYKTLDSPCLDASVQFQLLKFYTKRGSEESKVTNRIKEMEDAIRTCQSKKDMVVLTTIAYALWGK